MNRKTLTYFKNRLTKELKDLISGADCNFDGLNDNEESAPDLIDRASSYIDRSLSQNMCSRTSEKITKIEQCLEDIKNGDYGICDRCGDDIAIKRLKAAPLTRHCIHCQTEIENRARLVMS